MAFQANDGAMNTNTSSNAGSAFSAASGPAKPTVAEAKARLLAWGDKADAGRAQMISGMFSGVMPLVASGAVGAVGAMAASFFSGRRKASKPGAGAAGKTEAAPSRAGIFTVGNLVKVGLWLVPLILKHQSKSAQK